MSIILDANLLVALISGDPRGDQVSQTLLNWIDQGVDLHAPELAKYEVANALTRLIVGDAFPANHAEEAWNNLLILPITYHALANAPRVIEISLELNRQSAYDAAYLALAETLNAGLYTLDGPLYRNAAAQGFNIQLLE
jgi:predicted nucleic acid-binding protein